MRTVVGLSLTLALVSMAVDAAATLPRDTFDERDLVEMQKKSPRAYELFEQGDTKAAAGSLDEAEALFRQARAEFPDGALAARRHCEVLVALGRRSEAILACSMALGALHTGNNTRALVSSFIDGPQPPTMLELSQAVTTTAELRHKGLTMAVPAAACDIAERIGDEVMLQRCTEELVQLAPNDPATIRAQALLTARCPSWRFWPGWGAIGTAIVATLAHALSRLLRRRWTRAGVAGVAALVLALGSLPRIAQAADPKMEGFHALSKWPVDDENPSSKIPTVKERNAEPLEFGNWLQDCAAKAGHAAALGDHVAAARYYEALSVAVPDRAAGFSKACQEYEAAGDMQKAIDLCAQSLLREGLKVSDYTHFVHLVVNKPGLLSDKEKAAVANVIAHMREDPFGKVYADDLQCQMATRTSDLPQLRTCVVGMVQQAPDDAKTITYEWALAVADHHPEAAGKLLERAEAAGVAPETIAQMKKAASQHATWLIIRVLFLVAGVGIIAFAVAFGVRTFLERKRVGARRAGEPEPKAMPPADVLPAADVEA